MPLLSKICAINIINDYNSFYFSLFLNIKLCLCGYLGDGGQPRLYSIPGGRALHVFGSPVSQARQHAFCEQEALWSGNQSDPPQIPPVFHYRSYCCDYFHSHLDACIDSAGKGDGKIKKWQWIAEICSDSWGKGSYCSNLSISCGRKNTVSRHSVLNTTCSLILPFEIKKKTDNNRLIIILCWPFGIRCSFFQSQWFTYLFK